MKKRGVIVSMLVLFLLQAAGCSLIAGGGTPPVLTVDGIDITIGESRPYDLTSQGFETSFAGNYMVIGDMPGNSWLSDLMSAKKDDETYAYLYIYNPERESESYGLCKIYRMTFDMNSEEEDYWAKDNILVNGIDFKGMDSDEVKVAMADYELARETDAGSLRYEDGDYEYFFYFDEETGVVQEISVELTIPKSYDEAQAVHDKGMPYDLKEDGGAVTQIQLKLEKFVTAYPLLAPGTKILTSDGKNH